MKKLLLLLILSTLCLFGCGKSEQTNEEISEQLKTMAEEIVFEEEIGDEPLVAFEEAPKQVYFYKATVKNPTKTDFQNCHLTVRYVDEDGNEEESIIGDVNVVWKANESNTYILGGVLGSEKKIVSYEIISIDWLKVDSEDYVTVKLIE